LFLDSEEGGLFGEVESAEKEEVISGEEVILDAKELLKLEQSLGIMSFLNINFL